jgi:capsule polysaccharide export protein KpsE/RkpR
VVSYYLADIGRVLGFDPCEADKIAQYLDDEGLIEIMSKDHDVRITHAGVREVEEAIENPDKPTDHFLPVNIIQVGQMIDSEIAQASPGATQLNILTADDRRTIEEDLISLKEGIDQLKLPREQESDLWAEMDTIKAQMKSSKPKSEIIKAAYASIKGILQSAAGGVAAQIAIQLLSKLHF